jgi:hypothetical protein
MSITVAEADALAAAAHEGQTDQQGVAYIEHPRRVARRVDDDEARIAALLHDVMEDTVLTEADLVERGVPPPVIDALRLLTRAEDEDYPAFIGRIAASGNQLAIRVKLADLADNTDLSRGPLPRHLGDRYAKAIPALEIALASIED